MSDHLTEAETCLLFSLLGTQQEPVGEVAVLIFFLKSAQDQF